MNSDKLYSLYELLDKLVGHTDIACETNYDDESSDNLDILEQIGSYVIDKLYSNAKWSNDYRASANHIAKKSIRIAKDYKEYIDSLLEFDNLESKGE